MIVDSASPDALCPPLAATRDIVAARLGNVELEGTWHATYVLVHRSEGDFVLLDLRDPGGVSRLERQFPVQGGSCTTLAQVIALVLERFFLRPGGDAREDGASAAPSSSEATSSTPGPRAVDSTPLTEAGLDVSPASSENSAEQERPSRRSELAPEAQRASEPWSFDAGLWATNAWLAPSARVTHAVSGPFGLGLSAGVDLLDHQVRAAAGWVRTRRLPISLLGSGWLARGPLVSSSLSLELLALFEHAWTEGLAETGSGTRLVPGIGLRVGANFLGPTSSGPFADLTGTLLLDRASRFEVDDHAVRGAPTLVFGGVFGIRTPF